MKINILLLFVCLLGCQRATHENRLSENSILSSLITKAKNPTLSQKNKLEYGLEADSASQSLDDDLAQLESEKIIATAYLELGELVVAKKYFLKTLAIAHKLSDIHNEGYALNNLGIIYFKKSQYDSALQYYTLSNEIAIKTGDRLSLAQGLTNIGMLLKNQSDFEKAFDVTLRAAKIFDSCKSLNDLAFSYSTLGNILKDLQRYDDGLHYHQQALQIFNKTKDSIGIGIASTHIANIYRYKKEYSKALNQYQYALDIKEKLGLHKTTGTINDNIGQVYFELNKYKEGEEFFLRALKLRADASDYEGTLLTMNRLSRLYLKQNALKKAKENALKTKILLSQYRFLMPKLDNTLILSEIYECERKYDSSTIFTKEALLLKDSSFNADMATAISKMHIKYETEKKEKENTLLKKDKIISEANLEKQRNQKIFFAIVCLCAVTTTVFIIRSWQKSMSLSREKEKVFETENELAKYKAKSKLHNLASNFNRVNLLLIENNLDESKNFTKKLGAYYGLSNEHWDKEHCSFLDEIDIMESYCEVLKQYKSNIATTVINVSGFDLSKVAFINNVLDTLLDNAVNHGFNGRQDACMFTVTIQREYEDYLKISVEDNGNASDVSSYLSRNKKSNGLAILKERIERKHSTGSKYSDNAITIYTAAGKGTKIDIIYPLIYLDETAV